MGTILRSAGVTHSFLMFVCIKYTKVRWNLRLFIYKLEEIEK